MNDPIFDQIRDLRSEDPDWASSPAGRRVLDHSKQHAASPAPMHNHRRPLLIAGGAGATVLLAGTAAATVLFGQADSPTQAGCWESFDVQANTTEAPAALVEKVGPVEACARTLADLDSPTDISNLVSCVNEFGGRGVFPAPAGMSQRSACEELGWAVDAG